jgi:hypothetical protein
MELGVSISYPSGLAAGVAAVAEPHDGGARLGCNRREKDPTPMHRGVRERRCREVV